MDLALYRYESIFVTNRSRLQPARTKASSLSPAPSLNSLVRSQPQLPQALQHVFSRPLLSPAPLCGDRLGVSFTHALSLPPIKLGGRTKTSSSPFLPSSPLSSYFSSWTASFYPQVILNHQTKSLVDLPYSRMAFCEAGERLTSSAKLTYPLPQLSLLLPRSLRSQNSPFHAR